MERFCSLMAQELRSRGHEVKLARPQKIFGGSFISLMSKWLGYVDKYAIFPMPLKFMSRWAEVVHICDHSNAMYLPLVSNTPSVLTCHDLLAVRAALGEETH